MRKFIARQTPQRYVIQTYSSWTEPQYETHIANNLQEVKEISDNSEKVEAVYLLGKEITYSKNKRSLGATKSSKEKLSRPSLRSSLDGYANSADRLVALL
jgi:hypothetical protein